MQTKQELNIYRAAMSHVKWPLQPNDTQNHLQAPKTKK